jgi:TatD DNase family protein
LSQELELPLVIHQREAAADTLRILREEKAGAFGGVFHCFAGDLETAQAAMGLGFRIAVGGILTFSNAAALRAVVKALPLEALVLETDGPWLAPQSQRGLRNEPAFMLEARDKLAELKGLSPAAVEEATTANALHTFYLDAPEASTIGYTLKGGYYINLTNRCTDHCSFCDRRRSNPKGNHIQGLNLTLRREPTATEVLRAIGDSSRYTEVVFCGFGEPTLRLDTLKAISRDLARHGTKVRLNTNGHGNKLHGRDITPELAAAGVHTVSVSLNAQDAATYQKICRSSYPAEEAYQAVKDFIRAAKASLPQVVASAVTVPQADIEACRKIAEQELGVEFRVRGFQTEL